MRSHLRLPNLSDLNLMTPSLCHSPTSSFPSSYLSRSSSIHSNASSTSSTSSTSTTIDKPELVCPPSPVSALILSSWYKYDWANSSDALADWLNARWKKSGYVVDRRVVHFLIKMDGVRDVQMELGDCLGGAFVRPLRVSCEVNFAVFCFGCSRISTIPQSRPVFGLWKRESPCAHIEARVEK
ncbi:hypothetical protein KCU90_g232, partial [Aureobasidium melanogenum]